MNNFRESSYLLAGGAVLVLLGVYVMHTAKDGMHMVPGVLMCIIGAASVIGMSCSMYRDWKNGTLFPKILKPEERKLATELPMELPWPQLAARFHGLAPRDEMIVADEPPGFLSWNDGEVIQIFHTAGQSTAKGRAAAAAAEGDADSWLALYWVNDDNYLRDTELAALLRRHKLPMQESYRKMKATGLAVYRSGTLTLYPAAFEPEFRRSFLTSVLAPEATFRPWAEDRYVDEEEAEEGGRQGLTVEGQRAACHPRGEEVVDPAALRRTRCTGIKAGFPPSLQQADAAAAVEAAAEAALARGQFAAERVLRSDGDGRSRHHERITCLRRRRALPPASTRRSTRCGFSSSPAASQGSARASAPGASATGRSPCAPSTPSQSAKARRNAAPVRKKRQG